MNTAATGIVSLCDLYVFRLGALLGAWQTFAWKIVVYPSLSRPLEGIRVLDLTMALAGPYASFILASMGAQVIRIEAPRSRDGARNSPPFLGPRGWNHGAPQPDEVSLSVVDRAHSKQSVTLNLKTEQGRVMFMDLVKLSDVVLENMSHGTTERLQIDWPQVQAVNPRIVYASISGFGDNPAFEGLKGSDIIIQALSGWMHVTGEAGGAPTRIGVPVADLVTPLFAVNGILAALVQRGRTGAGQHVQVAMLDCMVALLAAEHLDVAAHEGRPLRTGNSLDRLVPFGVYACQDGHIALVAHHSEKFAALADAMQHPELMHNPQYLDLGFRQQHAAQINAWIEAWTQQHTMAQVLEAVYTQRGIPAAPVRSPMQALADPHLLANGAIGQLAAAAIGGVLPTGLGQPIQFSAVPAMQHPAAQTLGQANADVYGELLGLSPLQLQQFQAQGVI